MRVSENLVSRMLYAVKQRLYYSGVISFWTISDNQIVIDTPNKRNGRGKATPILCFDFLPCIQRYLLINY